MTIIGISVGLSAAEQRNQGRYVAAVLRAGGSPVMIPAVKTTTEQLIDTLNVLDGLLLTGGGDIHPGLYRAATVPDQYGVDPDRDEHEIAAFCWMQARGKRVLGVCRGAQLMAVATGGSLFQDLPTVGYLSHRDPAGGFATWVHKIKVEPNSLMDRMLGDLDRVNSHHHQAVQHPGHSLRPTVWAEDGVVEALEGENLLAVQWHPEVAAESDSRHLRPFRWLINGEQGVEQ